MSRFIEKLKKQRQQEPQPMGFLSNKSKTVKNQMLLIARISADVWGKLSESLTLVDAVVFDVVRADDMAAVVKAGQNNDSPPTGGWIKSSSAAVLRKAIDAECDFLIFPSSVPVSLARQEKLGRIMELDGNLSDGLLRAASDLPVDGFIVASRASETVLTMQDLLHFQRILLLVNKPLIAVITDNFRGPELQSLWDIGVGGVIIEASGEKALENMAEIRAEIDKLEPPAFRKKSKITPLLPRAAASAPPPPPGHEEEEDE
ncbi:MAG TPA: hypothetical protein VLH15_07885 [Dehalococcoidales bacterium]|nr:hypothetical protein [Dehalococcoidales bacterium]